MVRIFRAASEITTLTVGPTIKDIHPLPPCRDFFTSSCWPANFKYIFDPFPLSKLLTSFMDGPLEGSESYQI